jgi:hypothetical protein
LSKSTGNEASNYAVFSSFLLFHPSSIKIFSTPCSLFWSILSRLAFKSRKLHQDKFQENGKQQHVDRKKYGLSHRNISFGRHVAAFHFPDIYHNKICTI